MLRLELEVPESEKLTISDLLIGGNSVLYPGQIADLLSVHLFVTSWKRTDAVRGPVVACNATCCRQHGADQLVISDGKCQGGYDLAFPDLLPSGIAMVAALPRRTRASSAVVISIFEGMCGSFPFERSHWDFLQRSAISRQLPASESAFRPDRPTADC